MPRQTFYDYATKLSEGRRDLSSVIACSKDIPLQLRTLPDSGGNAPDGLLSTADNVKSGDWSDKLDAEIREQYTADGKTRNYLFEY